MKLYSGIVFHLILVLTSDVFGRIPNHYSRQPESWFATEDGRRITRNVLSWQSRHGSWPKNTDTASEAYKGDPDKLRGTFDNGATTGELRFLAQAYRATHDDSVYKAFLRGLNHILEAQYPNGGWPQYAPPGDGYARHITFNDNSMVRLLQFLQDVATSEQYAFLTPDQRKEAKEAFDRGIQCILDCQIEVNGQLTVWCAQHDENTLKPRPARSYELESLSGSESAGILKLLMQLDAPTPDIQRAIQAGVQWFRTNQINGIRIERVEGDKKVVSDPNAPTLWARFYEIDTQRPFFCGRDGIKKFNLSEIEAERRNGYAWYGNWGREVLRDYEVWEEKWGQ